MSEFVKDSKRNTLVVDTAFTRYLRFAREYQELHPHQRVGQTYVNALHEIPGGSEIIYHMPIVSGLLNDEYSPIDPFYDDSALPEFLTFVREKLAKGE